MTFSPSTATGRARPARAGRRTLVIATAAALMSGALLPVTGAAYAGRVATVNDH
ncbi:hypothetical protein [Streptomyces sp. IBSBF 3010]|uniref:hypothetical protein n=1 Tax=Streptomyces sp. IBSBF 3010 TaxID=2903526 RepID=UPI002FDBDD04